MKKQIITLLTLSALVSCGRQAEEIKAPNNSFAMPNFQALSVKGTDYDSNVRAFTLVAYPNDSEVANFEYETDQDLYDAVFNSSFESFSRDGNDINTAGEQDLISFNTSSIPRIVSGTPSEKVAKIVNQIIQVGKSRDLAYKNYVLTQRLVETELNTISDLYDRYSVIKFYKVKERTSEHKNKYLLTDDGTLSVKEEVAKSCKSLERKVKKLASIVDATKKAEVDALIVECNDTEEDQARIDAVAPAVEQLIIKKGKVTASSTFGKGKEYVTSLLETLASEVGKIFLSTAGTKESILEAQSFYREHISQVEFAADGKSFTQFALYINLFGDEQWYSVANGKIKNLRVVDLGDAKAVRFTIVGPRATVEADLGVSISQDFGLRMVGDAVITYTDGTVNDGAMKIELDNKFGIMMPF